MTTKGQTAFTGLTSGPSTQGQTAFTGLTSGPSTQGLTSGPSTQGLTSGPSTQGVTSGLTSGPTSAGLTATNDPNETKSQSKLVDIEVKDEVMALNLIVSFLNLAQRRGAFSLDESSKLWECIKMFQKPV